MRLHLEIVDNRAVLIRTRNPRKYEIIPKSKVVADDGDGGYTVAVYWGLDEMRVLRNLGVKRAPSPIRKNYDWPGRYKPMSHQIDTAEFMTMHRRCFCFNEQGCVDADTEYLSPTGWKRIADYDGGLVAQYHPELHTAEFVEPEAFVKLPCTDMIRLKTKYGIDQLLSPEHRVLVHSNAADKHVVMSAEDVLAAHDDWHAGVRRPNPRKAGSDTISFSHMAIPTAFMVRGGEGLELNGAQLRVQVAIIADGHFGSKTNRCMVRLKRERKVARMRSLLLSANIDFKERTQNTPTAKGFTIFTFDAPLRVKEFDARFWECTIEQRRVIAEEVLHWDGTHRRGASGDSFSTTSKASADFIQFVFVSEGITARITEDRRPKYKSGVCYTVQIRNKDVGSHLGLLALKSSKPTMAREASTDGFKYCFTVPSTFLVFRRNGCVFASGNTGKTLSALWAADYLMRRGEIRRVLVVCPLSTMQSVWIGDINNSIMHRSAVVAHHPQAMRRVELVQGDYEFVILNYDGLELVGEAINNDGRFDLIIVDEANAYKNTQTDRWKALARIITPTTFLWMMTGTPAAQSPVDAFGLAKLVNPNGVPRFQTAWRDKVMYKLTKFKWAPKDDAREQVNAALQPAIRFTKAQCMDLPPVLTETRQVAMTAQQQKYYKLIKDQMMAQAAGTTITAVNAGVVINKLLQISAGAVYGDAQDTVVFDSGPRLKVLTDIVLETDRKVLVFAMFRSCIDTIVEHLEKHGIKTAQIHGGVGQMKRGQIIEDFQSTNVVKALVMQPYATAHGITLTAADTVVFYGPLTSVEMYLQCIARSDRKGQTADKVTVIHIQSSPVEERLFKAMGSKVNEQALLVGMFEAELKN